MHGLAKQQRDIGLDRIITDQIDITMQTLHGADVERSNHKERKQATLGLEDHPRCGLYRRNKEE